MKRSQTGSHVLAFAGLLALLGLTIAASHLRIGPWGVTLALAIAAAKAGLVMAFFMQLRRRGALVTVFALGGALWLVILFALTFADYATR